MKKKLMLIGGGGHCHSVIDSVLSLGEYDEIGIVDTHDNPVMGISVIGSDVDIPKLIEAGWTSAFITVGSIGDTSIRRTLYQMITEYNLDIPVIIDPSALIAKNVEIKKGSYIGKRAVINSGTVLGICSIINTGAIIEHDCYVGDFAHVSSGATVCGNVAIGNDSHLGAGSTVRQNIIIGSNSIIGAGSIVVKDVPNSVKAYGNPCKVV